MDNQLIIDIMIKASKEGGKVLKSYFGQVLEAKTKSNLADFQTKADIDSETAICSFLEKELPDFNIFTEEKGSINKGSNFTFFIDPLDGTNNFLLGIPNFSVSIGLFQDEDIIAGVVYNPVLDNVYHAQKGKGAYLNNVKIKVSEEKELKRITMCRQSGYNVFDEEVNIVQNFGSGKVKRIMTNWSPAFDFCLLASGRVENIVCNQTEIYDFCAGKLIAKEAGAIITDYAGNADIFDKASQFVVSNTQDVHDAVLELIN